MGIVSIQGDVQEHVDMVSRAMKELKIKGEALPVKRGKDIDAVDALVLPGGESTTISKLMNWSDVYETVTRRVREDDLPVLGTCAGCILLASKGDADVKRTKTKLLGLMDMKVSRNSYGRQVDSFEAVIDFPELGDDYHAVFIRAPSILKVGSGCRVLATFDDRIVAAAEGKRMALTFHPELTEDTRVHRYFLRTAME